MTKVIDLGDPNVVHAVDKLETVCGYCIIVDIVGSTELKVRELRVDVADG